MKIIFAALLLILVSCKHKPEANHNTIADTVFIRAYTIATSNHLLPSDNDTTYLMHFIRAKDKNADSAFSFASKFYTEVRKGKKLTPISD